MKAFKNKNKKQEILGQADQVGGGGMITKIAPKNNFQLLIITLLLVIFVNSDLRVSGLTLF